MKKKKSPKPELGQQKSINTADSVVNKVNYEPGGTEVIQFIATEKLFESDMNPRKHYDKKAINELTSSIKEKGIVESLVVRFDPDLPFESIDGSDKYEIVVGSRRFRAAKLAGLKAVPCVVRNYSDGEALEIMVIENNQREDVHPLEEGEGYKKLLELTDEPGNPIYTVESIAGKIGRSDKYVRERLQLAHLVPAAKKSLEENKIHYTHARLLARLKPEQQEEALRNIIEGNYLNGKTFTAPKSIKYLEEWISLNIEKSLGSAVFSLDDAELVKSAGACNVCPKNTACDMQLFPEYATSKKGVCLDPKCFAQKVKAQGERLIKEKVEESEEEVVLVTDRRYDNYTKKFKNGEKTVIGFGNFEKVDKKTPGAKKAVMVGSSDMEKKGMTLYAKVKKSTVSKSANTRSRDLVEEQRKQKQEEEKRIQREKNRERINKVRYEVLIEIAKKQKGFTEFDWRSLIHGTINSQHLDRVKKLMKEIGNEKIFKGTDSDIKERLGKMSHAEMQKYLVLISLSNGAELRNYDLENYKKEKDGLYNKALDLGIDYDGMLKASEIGDLLVTFAGMKYKLKELEYFEELKAISELIKKWTGKDNLKKVNIMNPSSGPNVMFRRDGLKPGWKFSEWIDPKDGTALGFDRMKEKEFVKMIKGFKGKPKSGKK